MLIVGDGPLQSVLEEKAHELNLMGSCRFLGVRRDIPEILSALDVLIMPSVSEGLPYVLLEALAMGLPVVASLVNGVEEIIPDGEGGGYTIPSRSPERIVDALMAIHQVPDEAKRRAERGRRRVRQVFDASVSVRRWQDLYLQLRMDMSLQGGHRPTKQCLYP